jgi:nucleoside-diphosphate-sugar epimerase
MEASEKGSVLVTGGRGFIGRSVSGLLQREGYRVLTLDVSPGDQPSPGTLIDGRSELQKTSSRELSCDISDPIQLQSVFESEPIGAAIHLAAVLPTAAQRDPLRATQVSVGGSLNLLELSRQFGVRRVVFGSSLSIYGTWPIDERVAETHRAAPEDLYGAAKLYVERLGEAYASCYTFDFISLRIGRVVGPGARSVSSAWRSQIFEELRTSVPIEISLPFVASESILLLHVDDVARMLLTLLEASNPAHAVYNAPCESVVVADLKRDVESLNPNVRIKLGTQSAVGNPRLLDSSRFDQEFSFRTAPIFGQLRQAAGK